MDTTLDPNVVNLAKAIRQTESGGNVSARGKSGEYGAYQFTQPTWQKLSQKYGISVPLESTTIDQQNEVAYKQLKEWKDKGFNPGQIASMWNAGEGEPDAYQGTFSNGQPSTGTNKQGAKFDVPKYAQSVAQAYQTIKQGGQASIDVNNPSSVAPNSGGFVNPNAQQQTPQSGNGFVTPPQTQPSFQETTQQQSLPEQPQSFLSDVGHTLSETGQNISSSVRKGISGEINPASGILQSVGALAGGVNSLTTDALHHIPVVGEGVKKAEEYIGKGVEYAAGTELGQKGLQKYGEFSQEHPEAAGNIGAAVNVATAIPILKGVGATSGTIKRGIQGALKGSWDDIVAGALKTTPKLSEIRTGVKQGLITEGKYGPEMAADAQKQLSAKYLTDEIKTADLPKTSSQTKIAQFADDAGDAEAIRLEKLLDDADVQNILQPEELKGLADRVAERAGNTLVSGEKPAEELMKVFMDNLPKGKEILPVDILRARRAVGQYVRQMRGDWSQRGVYTGFKSARDAFWDESRTLLKNAAPDIDVLGSLEKQTALYRVIDYMDKKILSELKNTELMKSNFFNRHPLVKGAVNYLMPEGLLPHAVKGLLGR